MSKKNKNNTKSKLIPELRFPEFKDKPQWEVKELGEVMDYEQPSPYLIESTAYSVSGTPVLTANKSFILGYTEETTGIYDNIPAIIFDDFTTDSKFVNFPFKIKSSAIKILKAKKNNNLSFLFYTLSKISYQAREHQRHYISQFQPMNIPLPSLSEQERIGALFSTLDSLIQAQSKEVQLLRLRKKGLMQKMFPYEGETTPEWRFPEFKDAPEWEVKTIEEIGTIVTGNTPSKKNDNYWGGDFVWVTAEDMKSKYVSNSVNKLTELGKSKARVIPKNSVLVTCIASIGLNCINKVACATNQQINAIICNEQYCNEFVFYSISNIENLLKNYSGQTAVPIINKGDFQLLSLPLPSLPEQERIASLFSTLDSLIDAKSRRLEQLKNHKKGLMQKMFP